MKDDPFANPIDHGDFLSAKGAGPVDPGWAAWLNTVYGKKDRNPSKDDPPPIESAGVKRDSLD